MNYAVIFDFDGLLVDTETPEFQAWQEIYSEHGCSLSFSAWEVCIGTSVDAFDPILYLEEQVGGPVDRKVVADRHRNRFHELAYAEPLMDGVESVIGEANRLELKLAIGSSARREWIESHLADKGILPKFDCIKTSEDVQKVKPAPDLFLAVLQELKLPPERAIVLEDSRNGIKAARQAGIYAIAVPNPTTRQMTMDGANEVLDSLTDLDLGGTLRRVEAFHNGRSRRSA